MYERAKMLVAEGAAAAPICATLGVFNSPAFRRISMGLMLALLVAMPAMAQDFRIGEAAYDSGDYAAALREWRPLAAKGDSKAQKALGFMYVTGQGVPQDSAEALKWYRKAAAQGDDTAQYKFGFMHPMDLVVPADDAEETPDGNDHEDTQPGAAGGNFAFGGWSAVGRYRSGGDFNQPTMAFRTSGNTEDVDWWDLALGYGTGPLGVSFSLIRPIVAVNTGPDPIARGGDDDTFEAYTLGATYKLGTGMQIYGDLVFSEPRTDFQAVNPLEGDGVGLILGIEGKF